NFSRIGNISSLGAAAWDGTSFLSLGGLPGEARALAVWNDELIVATTATLGPPVSKGLRRVGQSWVQIGGDMNGPASPPHAALAVCRGDLIAAGLFSTAGGTPVSNIARWDGSAWQPLDAGVNGETFALLVTDDTLVAAGAFTMAGG